MNSSKFVGSFQEFCQEAERRIRQGDRAFAMGAMDADNFKYINCLFGYHVGDAVLGAVSKRLEEGLGENELFARVYGDQFVLLLEERPEVSLEKRMLELTELSKEFSAILPEHYSVVINGGVYSVQNLEEKISMMLDYANYARKQAKGNPALRFLRYSAEMEEEMAWKRKVTTSIGRALHNGELKMYLQPKISLQGRCVMGAEALVRWQHPEEGLIQPDNFIPILEQNGYVCALDFYMLEQACAFLQSCKSQGLPVLPISVNFSKLHVGEGDFPQTIFAIVKKYGIAPALIEVELAESVAAENFDTLVFMAKELKELGFSVALDDFGKAYSSLNYLKDLPLNIVKLDRGFLQSSGNTEKGRLIAARMVEMVKALHLTAVMEGIEEAEQADFMRTLCCDIGQGYYYARPMPVADYEEYLRKHASRDPQFAEQPSTEPAGLPLPLVEQKTQCEEISILEKNIDMGLIKGYLDSDVTVEYVNEQALEYLGYTRQEFQDVFKNRIVNFTHPDDASLVEENIRRLGETKQAIHFRTRALRKDGKIILLDGRATCVQDESGRPMGVYAFQDVTEDLVRIENLEAELEEKIEELQSLYTNIPGGVFSCNRTRQGPPTYVSQGFEALTGYLLEELKNSFFDLVVEEDREQVRAKLNEQLEKCGSTRLEYRIQSKDGKQLWVLEQGQNMQLRGGDTRFYGVLVDVTAEKESVEALRISEERYKIVLEQSEDILFEWNFETDAVVFIERPGRMSDFPPVVEHASVNEDIMEYVYEEDRENFRRWREDTYRQTGQSSAEFRLRTNGVYIWTRILSTSICNRDGTPLKAIGVFTNIDRQKSTVDALTIKSMQDPLTKLYNKEETEVRVERYLQNAAGSMEGALFMIDIDNFKGVNDNLGHQFGDMVLQEVAAKIKKLFRDADIVGRLGGDEFAVFAPDIGGEQQICVKAEALIAALHNVYFGKDARYEISGSVGVAICPQHGTHFEELYRLADGALYESKNKGKARYTIFRSEIKQEQQQRTPMESPRKFVSTYFVDDPIFNIFEMLYETKDIDTTLQKVLEITGKRFGVDRVYVFERNMDNDTYSNTYEWCAQGISAEKDSLQNLGKENMEVYLGYYDEEGIFCCNDTNLLEHPLAQEILQRQGIRSMLQCAIGSMSEIRGLIGFDECKRQRTWTEAELAMLVYISRMLSIFITRRQFSEELLESYQHYMGMLDNLNGYVYVVDVQNYELLYVNKAAGAMGGARGHKCHKIAFGIEEPCTNCPVRLLTEETTFAASEIYSVLLNSWVNSAASKLNWSGRAAALVCCTDITKYKRCEEKCEPSESEPLALT